LREKHVLKVFQNRALRKTFGPKKDEVTGGWGKLHNEKLYNLYSSPNMIRVIKSRRMKRTGHEASMPEMRPEGNRPLEIPRRRRLDNINLNFQEVDWEACALLIWLRIRTGGGLL
jgi:hypothetical protein